MNNSVNNLPRQKQNCPNCGTRRTPEGRCPQCAAQVKRAIIEGKSKAFMAALDAVAFMGNAPTTEVVQ